MLSHLRTLALRTPIANGALAHARNLSHAACSIPHRTAPRLRAGGTLRRVLISTSEFARTLPPPTAPTTLDATWIFPIKPVQQFLRMDAVD